MKTRGYLLAIISAFSYGLIPLFIIPIKAIDFSIDTTLFYRFSISAALILCYLIYKKESLMLNRSELIIMIFLGLFYALSSDFLFLGYDYLTPGIASTILFIYPVIVALIMTFFFKERITKLTILSLVIAIAGVFVLSAKDSILDINFAGLCITILSALFYALYIVVVNKSKIKASGSKITFYSLLFSSSYYLIKNFILGGSLMIPNMGVFIDFALFSLITTVLSVSALVYAIKLIGSTPTSIVGALEPLVAVGVSVVLFGEVLTISLIVGIILILTGVIINIISNFHDQ